MALSSWDPDWERSNRSTLAKHGTDGPISPVFPDSTNLSSTYGGGSFLWIVQENVSVTVGPDVHASPSPRVRDVALARVEIAILGLVLALTALGNSFVLWVLLRKRKQHAPMHLFMVNLCVADLVVAFFQVLPQLVWDITERFQGPDALCRSVKYLQIVGMFASSYMIVAMTIDRHYAICCPMQAYRSGATSHWNIPVMVAWGLALLFSVPQVFIFSMSEVSPGQFDCWGHFTEPWGLKAYVTWMTVAVFVLPAFIITVCQVRIFREIHDNIYLKSERSMTVEYRRSSILFHFRDPSRDRRGRRRKERRSGRQGQSSTPLQSDNHSSTCPPCGVTYDRQPPSLEKVPDSCNENFSHSSHLKDQPWLPSDHTASSHDHGPSCLALTAPSTDGEGPLHQNPVPHAGPYHDLRHGALLLPPSGVCTNPSPPNPSSGIGGFHEVALDSIPCPPPVEYPPEHPPIPLSIPPPGVSKAMSKTVRMTLVIVLVYTVCWSPFFIVQLWAAWDPNPPDQGVAFTILMLLASLNSCTNPWIYTAFSSSVSRELQALLRCRSSRASRRASLPDDSTTTTHTSTAMAAAAAAAAANAAAAAKDSMY